LHADKPELLYTRTYSCACAVCRKPSSVAIDGSRCPLTDTVGRWRQQTIHPATNVLAQRKVMLDGIKEFQAKIKPDKLYAAYASYREELGGRPYWLLRAKSKALTNKTIKVPGGTTIAKNQYYIEAQWYLSSYDIRGCKKYKLLEEIVHVPVSTMYRSMSLSGSMRGGAAARVVAQGGEPRRPHAA
jgi:hypothetical protein